MSQALVLIGNPNVGKSLLFGCLTNRYVNVSNYPGTTVEITSAMATIAGHVRLVIDTPGTNGLIPHSDDERVTRDILLNSPGADVMQVGDYGWLSVIRDPTGAVIAMWKPKMGAQGGTDPA